MCVENRRLTYKDTMGEEVIMKEEEQDLGVIIQDINVLSTSIYRTLTNIRAVFNYMDKTMMKKIITTMMRPSLQYVAVLWSSHILKDIRKIERMQRIPTKMVPEVKDLPYEDK